MTTPLPTAAQLEAWSIDQEFSRHIEEAKERGAGSDEIDHLCDCLLYTSPSPRDRS